MNFRSLDPALEKSQGLHQVSGMSSNPISMKRIKWFQTGIGIVTCVYINPEEDAYWVLDYRIYDPERDGKTKIEHVLEMLGNCHYQKRLPFGTVLMDT